MRLEKDNKIIEVDISSRMDKREMKRMLRTGWKQLPDIVVVEDELVEEEVIVEVPKGYDPVGYAEREPVVEPEPEPEPVVDKRPIILMVYRRIQYGGTPTIFESIVRDLSHKYRFFACGASIDKKHPDMRIFEKYTSFDCTADKLAIQAANYAKNIGAAVIHSSLSGHLEREQMKSTKVPVLSHVYNYQGFGKPNHIGKEQKGIVVTDSFVTKELADKIHFPIKFLPYSPSSKFKPMDSVRANIGILGRCSKEKQINHFSIIAAKIREDHPGVNFIWVGGQSTDDEAEMFGKIMNGEIAATSMSMHPERWLAGMDLVLVTSSKEGGPNCAAEALACGIPIIGYDVGMLKYWKEEGLPVTIVNNKIEMIAAITKFLQYKELHHKDKVNYFDCDKMVKEYDDCYTNLITSNFKDVPSSPMETVTVCKVNHALVRPTMDAISDALKDYKVKIWAWSKIEPPHVADVTFFWNGTSLAHRELAKTILERGDRVIFVEHGWLPQTSTVQMDMEGVNANASWCKEELTFRKGRHVKVTDGRMLVICQRDNDSQIRMHSPFFSCMREYLEHLRDNSELDMVIRLHPRSPVLEIQEYLDVIVNADNMTIDGNKDLSLSLSQSSCVATINSGVGIQTLQAKKPLLVYGEAIYRHPGAVYCMDPDFTKDVTTELQTECSLYSNAQTKMLERIMEHQLTIGDDGLKEFILKALGE